MQRDPLASFEPAPSSRWDDADLDAREPDTGEHRARPRAELDPELGPELDADGDPENSVSYRPGRLPARETEEEELAEADIMEILDLDDLKKMEGPDA
jgi:hypothetical protein